MQNAEHGEDGASIGRAGAGRIFITDEQIDLALEYLRTSADYAAKARAERAYVEEYRKTVKAQIMKENADLPIGAQEREAYADPRYVAHLEAIREAVMKDEKARFLRVAAEARIEAWRTQSSNERAIRL